MWFANWPVLLLLFIAFFGDTPFDKEEIEQGKDRYMIITLAWLARYEGMIFYFCWMVGWREIPFWGHIKFICECFLECKGGHGVCMMMERTSHILIFGD